MFDSTAFGYLFSTLYAIPHQSSLGPGTPTAAARFALNALTVDRAFEGLALVDREMARACLSGIWLYHNYLDESHRISQSITNDTGNFWHAILHRREPDAWNSKYWFDRVRPHPVYPALQVQAGLLARGQGNELAPEARFLLDQSEWQPHRFVDLCEMARVQGGKVESLCLAIQAVEWQVLFAYCYRLAAQNPE